MEREERRLEEGWEEGRKVEEGVKRVLWFEAGNILRVVAATHGAGNTVCKKSNSGQHSSLLVIIIIQWMQRGTRL